MFIANMLCVDVRTRLYYRIKSGRKRAVYNLPLSTIPLENGTNLINYCFILNVVTKFTGYVDDFVAKAYFVSFSRIFIYLYIIKTYSLHRHF